MKRNYWEIAKWGLPGTELNRLTWPSLAAVQVHRLHNLNNPNTPLPISGDDLADYIKNAASGALDVLQQSYSVPSFCELHLSPCCRVVPRGCQDSHDRLMAAAIEISTGTELLSRYSPSIYR